jgi:cytochrome c oxidase subunit I+III
MSDGAATDTPPEQHAELHAELDRAWGSPKGFFGWFRAVNHKQIGRRFIVTGFVFFALGGVLALIMRLQLAQPNGDLVSADTYRQIMTMHGTTMMFFFAVPVMEGFAIFVVPLMIGTRDMAFPRLNAFGYYVYLIAGIVLYLSLFLGMAPDAGWFAYVPLAGPEYSPGLRMDVWATMITFIEVSALVAAVELIVTILKQRAPGMTLTRMPLFVWAILVMSVMIVFAMPPVMVASIELALDRAASTHFFNPATAGDPLLWQHLFWFFGHPEVYIIFIPALGFVSAIIVTATRRPIIGYTPIVVSLVATGLLGFGLWVHHMFTTGLPQLGMNMFTAASMMIAIPSGVQIFCWTASLWRTRPRLTTATLFVLGFFVIFVAGGLTGVMVASVPFDLQVHDTFFVVAHLHYVLIGGAVFPLFAAVFHWFPKLVGRRLDERLGKVSFVFMFVGFNVAFFPMHHLGLIGMPRRVYTYPSGLGWGSLNAIATGGVLLLTIGVLVLLVNVILARRRPQAPGDPWGADTLEWATDSPPPSYNFLYMPVVRGRWARWDRNGVPSVIGVGSDRREILLTSMLDATPRAKAVLPGPTAWPLALAASVSFAFVGMIYSLWAVPIGAAFTFMSITGWMWPRASDNDDPRHIPDDERATDEQEESR